MDYEALEIILQGVETLLDKGEYSFEDHTTLTEEQRQEVLDFFRSLRIRVRDLHSVGIDHWKLEPEKEEEFEDDGLFEYAVDVVKYGTPNHGNSDWAREMIAAWGLQSFAKEEEISSHE